MTDLTIRAYEPRDYERARELFGSVDELHRERVPWMFKAPDREPRPVEYLETQVIANDGALLVAVEGGGEVVGAVVILMRSAPDFPIFVQQRWGVIDSLVVAPTHRRNKVATRLLHAAEAWIKARGASWLELNVYDVNVEARAFYAAVGYLPFIHRIRKSLG